MGVVLAISEDARADLLAMMPRQPLHLVPVPACRWAAGSGPMKIWNGPGWYPRKTRERGWKAGSGRVLVGRLLVGLPAVMRLQPLHLVCMPACTWSARLSYSFGGFR